MMLMAFTASRPGTLIESNWAKGTNEALRYKDVSLTMIPNPITEGGPVIVMEITCWFMKGRRQVQEP